jgi:diaminohydroxyphosphoribosylaminopyrimidine deaminase/5-amino-6-(5-phosphoribosylamino)uracil reductase
MPTNLVYFCFLTFAALTADETYMVRCLQLARLGVGWVAPNPMVGAVLVYDGNIIGEGCHEVYGGPHAEVNCINSVAEENKRFISQSTLYVSLEPCAHFGKTPPCAGLIINERIPHVVVACRDPFEKVNGRGIDLLQAAGVNVREGVLEAEAQELNKRFFSFHKNKRPYIILKWAQTADGFIAGTDHQPLKISNELSNRWVHKMRSAEAAIMVGTTTALNDNPSLTTRLWSGKNPMRIVIDKELRLPREATLYNNSSQVVVLNFLKNDKDGHIRLLKISPGDDLLVFLMNYLYTENISSLVVEGGSVLLQSFLDAGLWDEAVVITNQALNIRDGIPAVTMAREGLKETFHFGDDNIGIFKNGLQ